MSVNFQPRTLTRLLKGVLEFSLSFGSICSIRIRSRTWDIFEKPQLDSNPFLQRLIPDPDKYAFGKTKIFFRAGQVAMMEKWRIDRLNASASIIQLRAFHIFLSEVFWL